MRSRPVGGHRRLQAVAEDLEAVELLGPRQVPDAGDVGVGAALPEAGEVVLLKAEAGQPGPDVVEHDVLRLLGALAGEVEARDHPRRTGAGVDVDGHPGTERGQGRPGRYGLGPRDGRGPGGGRAGVVVATRLALRSDGGARRRGGTGRGSAATGPAASDRPVAVAEREDGRRPRWGPASGGLATGELPVLGAVGGRTRQVLHPGDRGSGISAAGPGGVPQVRSRMVPVAIAPPADGDHGQVAVASFELVDGGGEQADARRADRVPERDRAAVHVEPVRVDSVDLRQRHRHRGEGLVHLEQVDVADGRAGTPEQLLAPTGPSSRNSGSAPTSTWATILARGRGRGRAPGPRHITSAALRRPRSGRRYLRCAARPPGSAADRRAPPCSFRGDPGVPGESAVGASSSTGR